jgi:hypothetical protein
VIAIPTKRANAKDDRQEKLEITLQPLVLNTRAEITGNTLKRKRIQTAYLRMPENKCDSF